MPGPSQEPRVRDPPVAHRFAPGALTSVLNPSPATHQLCPSGKWLTSLNPSVSIHKMGVTGVG